MRRLGWELRLLLRRPRVRLALLAYLALVQAPLLLGAASGLHALADDPARSLVELLAVQPVATAVLAVLVSGVGTDERSRRTLRPYLAASPRSAAGLLVDRWLVRTALIAVAALVAALPAVARALRDGSPGDGSDWLLAFGLLVLLPIPCVVAGWLGLATLCRGEMLAATVAIFLAVAAVPALDAALQPLRFRLDRGGDWLGLHSLAEWQRAFGGATRGRAAVASEAPLDRPALGRWVLHRGAIFAGACVLAFGTAALASGRCRRDLRPWRASPRHPLRATLAWLDRQRRRFALDAAPDRADRALALLAVALAVAAALVVVAEHRRHRRLMERRHLAERGDPVAPWAAGIEPRSVVATGRLGADGSLALVTRWEVAATAGGGHLAFALSPFVDVVRVTADGREVRLARHWDRLGVDLEPALRAGETATVEIALAGAPQVHEPRLVGYFGEPFGLRYERFLATTLVADVGYPHHSVLRRRASVRAVLLTGADLMPIPRRTPWTAVADEDWPGSRVVPDERRATAVPVTLDLAVPPGWALASSCGETSDGGRLRGRCVGLPNRFVVAGGGARELQRLGGVTMVALAAHRRAAAERLAELATLAPAAARAWPGLDGLAGLVLVEQPPPQVRPAPAARWGDTPSTSHHGGLVLLAEANLTGAEPLPAARLLANALAERLLARRRFVPAQAALGGDLLAALLALRTDLAGPGGATVTGPPWYRTALAAQPLLGDDVAPAIRGRRLLAVVAYLEALIGRETMRQAVDAFSRRSGAATLEELWATLAERSGRDLDAVWTDFVAGSALPRLRVEDAVVDEVPGGYRTRARIANAGTGETICPVRVETATTSREVTVRLPGGTIRDVEIVTAEPPHRVVVDPGLTCHRWIDDAVLADERVELAEGGR